MAPEFARIRPEARFEVSTDDYVILVPNAC